MNLAIMCLQNTPHRQRLRTETICPPPLSPIFTVPGFHHCRLTPSVSAAGRGGRRAQIVESDVAAAAARAPESAAGPRTGQHVIRSSGAVRGHVGRSRGAPREEERR